MSWWSDQNTTINETLKFEKNKIYAEKLYLKYGIEMNELMKATFDIINQKWIPYIGGLTIQTDDGCDHYIYNNKHYELNHLKDHEWFQKD